MSINGVAKLSQALIRDKRLENLYRCCRPRRPATRMRSPRKASPRVIDELRDRFDWIICDSPAGIERGATLAMRHADAAIIVTNPEVSSVRDSDRIIGLLDSKTVQGRARRARRQAPADHPLSIRRAPRAARCCDRRRAGNPARSRCSASFRRARRCCAPPMSARRSRSTIRSALPPAPTSTPPGGCAARRSPMHVPNESKGLFGKLFGRKAA